MSERALTLIPVADQARAYAAITAAFTDNPFDRWLYPDDDDYTTHFPEFVAAVAGASFAAEEAYQLEDFAAVALLRTPLMEADPEQIGATLRASVTEDKRDDLFGSLEQMEAAHPSRPHWYLPVIAVHPARRGKGLGSRLLAACLERVDDTGLPMFLQSYDGRTVPFFERHGFVRTGLVQVGSAPTLTMMLRKGRSE